MGPEVPFSKESALIQPNVLSRDFTTRSNMWFEEPEVFQDLLPRVRNLDVTW